MKKHTKLTILIGILFCNIPTIQASSNDNGPYSPAKIIPYAFGIITAFVINTTANICSHSLQSFIKQTQTDLAKNNDITSISHANLKQNQYIVQTSNNLPYAVIKTLNNEKHSFHTTAKTHIHFDDTNKEHGTLLAQKIAFQTDSNYYKIDNDPLNPQVNLKDFQSKITNIASQTTQNNPAVIYINFHQEKLTAPVFNQEVAKEHNLYQGTLAQAINDLSAKYPHIRIITNSDHQGTNTNKKTTGPKTNSYYDPTRILTNFTVFNDKKTKTQKPTDFLLVQAPQQTPKELSLYVEHTINKHNQKSSCWFWQSQSPKIIYKSSLDQHTNTYFHDISQEKSQEIIDKAIQQARITKLNDNISAQPVNFMQQICAIFTPKKVITIDNIDILAEIAAKKYQNDIPKKHVFTQKTDLNNLLKDIPGMPTKILTPQEREKLKNKYKTPSNFINISTSDLADSFENNN